MDAKSHLLSLGWLGEGHALNSHLTGQKGRGGLGLTKPLLVSQKKNTFGVGKKKHEPASGNDWWLKGFEKALQGVGNDGAKSARTSRTATPEVVNRSGYRGKHEGLYGHFVKGDEMAGTIDEDKVSARTTQRSLKKRKSGVLDSSPTTSDENTQRLSSESQKKQKKQKPREGSAIDFTSVSTYLAARDKDVKKSQRRYKQAVLAEFQQVSSFMGERDDVDPALAKRKKKIKDGENKALEMEAEDSAQDPEQLARLDRKRLRKEEKRRRKLLEAEGEEQSQASPAPPARSATSSSQWSSLMNGWNNGQEPGQEAHEDGDEQPQDDKENRRRRKEERRLRRMEKEERRRLKKEEKQTRVKTNTSTAIGALAAWESAIKA